MSVFYSYSNANNYSKNTYEIISEKMKTIDVSFTSNNENLLLDKILSHIDDSDLFVCDLTPDFIGDLTTNSEYNVINENTDVSYFELSKFKEEKIKPYINPNVMLELGYAINKFQKNNIILLYEENEAKKINKILPSMLSGFEILYYDSTNSEYYEDIYLKINEFITNLEKDNLYIIYRYKLSSIFIEQLDNLLDIKLKTYDIIFNKENDTNYKYYIQLYNNHHKSKVRYIDIKRKELHLLNDIIIDLSKFTQINDELRHLEIILLLKFL